MGAPAAEGEGAEAVMGRAEVGFDRERRITRILVIRKNFRPPRALFAERRPGEVGGRHCAGGAETVRGGGWFTPRGAIFWPHVGDRHRPRWFDPANPSPASRPPSRAFAQPRPRRNRQRDHARRDRTRMFAEWIVAYARDLAAVLDRSMNSGGKTTDTPVELSSAALLRSMSFNVSSTMR